MNNKSLAGLGVDRVKCMFEFGENFGDRAAPTADTLLMSFRQIFVDIHKRIDEGLVTVGFVRPFDSGPEKKRGTRATREAQRRMLRICNGAGRKLTR